MLDAPLPFIMGITDISNLNMPEDVIVMDLLHRTLESHDVVPPIPRWKEFDPKFKQLHSELVQTFGKEVPFITSTKQLLIVKKISKLFEKYLETLFEHFRAYCVSDTTQKEEPITIFMKDNFLESVNRNELAWYNAFLETQMFSTYQSTKVIQVDKARVFSYRYGTLSTSASKRASSIM